MIRSDPNDRGPRVLRVLGALLGDSPEGALLAQAARPPIAFRTVENRVQVLAALREHTPHVVVFAEQDRNRLPTAPLIRECLKTRPGSRMVVVCAVTPPRSGAVLAAARAGARVLIAPTSDELAFVLARIARSLTSEFALDCAALATVQPLMLQQLLCAAAKTVAADGRVDTLAQHLRVSIRTLSRHTRRTSRVSPKALLSAARLLWACMLVETARPDLGVVARQVGFAGRQALLATLRHYLSSTSVEQSVALLPSYRDALRRVACALGGDVAS